jgi:hypothetical protein
MADADSPRVKQIKHAADSPMKPRKNPVFNKLFPAQFRLRRSHEFAVREEEMDIETKESTP